jgi:predicted PurR-regulated permease PerM
MTAKTITSIVIAITILFVLLVTTQTQAEEVLPQKKPVSIQLQTKLNSFGTWLNERPEVIGNWATNEWEDIKQFQKANWQSGKEQTAKNFEKIKSFLVDKTTNR